MCLAVPGQIERIFEDKGTRMGKVNFGGVVKNVCLAYLPDIEIGDYTIVHVGFAISKIDDCLLYTSPSPRDQRGSRMPSSA